MIVAAFVLRLPFGPRAARNYIRNGHRGGLRADFTAIMETASSHDDP